MGGNLGDMSATLESAFAALTQLPNSRLLRRSSLYRTPAWGPIAQPDFLNAVALIETELVPDALLAHLLGIERSHGRERGDARWGPRTLDLDLLVHGDHVVDHDGLKLPHPHLHERAFVLVPAAEVAPDTLVPGRGRIDALLAALDCSGIERVENYQPIDNS
ncbi:MAG: 2-amino-4-hydroxy-6-hydroxymethyldihydropteridine diphosphokinase [Lysobacteraceae bacterium]